MPTGSHTKRNGRHNLASLVSGELIWLDTDGANPPDVLVPSEYAPVFAVDLPLPQHRSRLAALPFAIEDRVAQPLEELHFSLGKEISPRRYLASVVTKAQMADWQATLSAQRVTPHRIIPDATTLPLPDAGADWTVRVEGERVLVRTRTHEAFATSARLVAAMWIAAGRPALHQIGPGWLLALPEPVAKSDVSVTRASSQYALDLSQSSSTDAGRRYAVHLKVAAVMIASAAIAHTALLALDATSVGRAVAERKSEATQLVSSLAPLTPASDDPAAILAAMLPDTENTPGASRFLPMLSRISESIQPVANGVAMQGLSYDEADEAMQIKLEASDLPALERVQKSLNDAGFAAESAGASVGDGRAESSYTVRDSATADRGSPE